MKKLRRYERELSGKGALGWQRRESLQGYFGLPTLARAYFNIFYKIKLKKYIFTSLQLWEGMRLVSLHSSIPHKMFRCSLRLRCVIL